MEPQVWSDVLVECQTVLGAAVAITAISSANPAVASALAHGYTEGDAVLLRLNKAKGYEVAVVRVGEVASGTFELVGINGADIVGATGTAQEVTFGASSEVMTEVTGSGGEPADITIQTIHPGRPYNRPGKESPLAYAFGALWVPTDPVLTEFAKAQRKGELRGVRFEFADGSECLFAGYPSANLAPSGSAGAAVTTPAKVSVRGHLSAYEAE